MTDRDLLVRFIETGSDAAFRELVERHVGLVYAVARRQVRSSHIAEEVTQAVFVDLARDAARIPPDASLVGWLHVVARRKAIDVVRREVRRIRREQEAAEHAATHMTNDEPRWAEIEPRLDEAVEALPPADRSAILLRYFEARPLRDVGLALGVSEDAAQKRVSRAVDELRALLAAGGVNVSSAALAAALPVHALTHAPAGLVAAICAHALPTIGAAAGATADAARTLAMTTLQKTMLAGLLAVALGGGGYEAVAARRQAAEVARLRQSIDAQVAEARRLGTTSADTAHRLTAAETAIDAQLAAARAATLPGDAALEERMNTWLTRVDRMRATAAQRPELAMPEFQFLRDEDWMSVATWSELDTDAQLRSAFVELRRVATQATQWRLFQALVAYRAAHQDAFPSRVTELAGYGPRELPADVLSQYEVVPSWRLTLGAPRDDGPVIVRREPVDPTDDTLLWIGARGSGYSSSAAVNVQLAAAAFAKEHPHEPITTVEQIAPYLRWRTDPAALARTFSALQTRR